MSSNDTVTVFVMAGCGVMVYVSVLLAAPVIFPGLFLFLGLVLLGCLIADRG